MRLVYINIGRSSVFESQVLSLLNHYDKNRIFEEVILLFGYQSEDDKNWLVEKNRDKLTLIFFKSHPNYIFYNHRNKKSLYQALDKIDKSFQNYFFHIRTELTSFIFKKCTKKLRIDPSQVLTDVRGASIQEVQEYYATKPFLKPFKLINYKFALKDLKKDQHISAVSNSLKNHLLSAVKIDQNKIKINPCLISKGFSFNKEKRISIRRDLKLKDKDILMVFTSGGVAKWQKNDMIVKIAEMGFKVLNLSRVNVMHPNIINKFVAYEEVPGYLSAADISFIWRDQSVVNKVASPVKVSEYIACGLPIVHNGTVDMIGDLLIDKRESLQIGNIDELNFNVIETLIKQSNREKLCQKGLSQFGLASIAEGYQKIYGNQV